nr:uncharacterized protein LOC111418576 [Onthophagus taurus]
MEEELSRSEFARLNHVQRDTFLKRLLGDDEESEFEDDSEDEDWLPGEALAEEPLSDTENADEAPEGEGEGDVESDESESESESQAAGTSATDEAGTENDNAYIAKDKTVWSKTPPQVRQTPSHNVLRQRSGPHRSTESLSVQDTFKTIITVEMVDLIVCYTNNKATKVYNNYNGNNPDSQRLWKPITIQEMYAFIGVKIWWICDAENAYPLNGIIYSGKTGNVREKNQGERVVKELAVPFRGSGRNITMDNYFTTLPLAKHLLSWKLTIVGTLRKNKPYIPKQMAPHKSREEYSTLFGFHEHVTLCSYVPKKNKAVILLSTMHSDAAVNDDGKKKPHMITYYNKYKTGVDTMDQMVTRYTTRRRTQRWPLAMFFNILDVGALASYVIYYENNKMIQRKTNQRRTFLRQLSEELAKPFIEDRSKNAQIMRNYNTKIAIESVIGLQLDPSTVPERQAQPRDSTGRKKITGSCHICYKGTIKRRRKTRKSCSVCARPVCDEHSLSIFKCIDCAE